MKNKGFTLIELMIVVSIVGIFAVIFFTNTTGIPGNISIGINGISETRCIDGYKFVVGAEGNARQIYDSMGHGIPCSR